jgi:hypothetical protein
METYNKLLEEFHHEETSFIEPDTHVKVSLFFIISIKIY